MAETIYEIIKDSDGVECFIKRGELVRCKDCTHRGLHSCGWDTNKKYAPPDDWFCADGEHKEGR